MVINWQKIYLTETFYRKDISVGDEAHKTKLIKGKKKILIKDDMK